MHAPAADAPPLLALTGPTASGKSAVAMAVARALAPQHRVEIVSVDSALVYRGMDIGSAKPSAADRAEVPHHLIDLIEPAQAYSAARFVSDAGQAIAAIRGRGAWPLLVGGTMLYLKALSEGLDPLPAADIDVRAALDRRAADEGWPALHAELARVDPVTAARLAPHDAQRIQRALEVWQLSGRPLSALQGGAGRAGGIDLRLVSLEPGSRAWLHGRIAERFDAMMGAGFLDEVRAMRRQAQLHPGLPSVRCVGYRQAWAALDRQAAAGLSAPLPDFRDEAIAATRQLAKRQLTWLRSMPQREVVACDDPDAVAQATARLCDQIRHWASKDESRAPGAPDGPDMPHTPAPGAAT